MNRRRLIAGFASALAPIALLGGVELAARVASPEPPEVAFERDFVRRNLSYLDPCMAPMRREGEAWLREAPPPMVRGNGPPAEFRRARTAHRARIAVVGESSAFHLGSWMRSIAERDPCGRNTEVLSCGQPGSGMEHLSQRFDEVLGYAPDAVVVVFGHNLRFQFSHDATRLHARLLRLQSRALTLIGGSIDGPVRELPHFDARTRIDAYERFLRRANEDARRAHARLIVLTPGANLWMPPQGDLRGAEDANIADARIREAIDGPLAAATAIPATSDVPAERFVRGVLLARGGDAAGARAELEGAMNLDGAKVRAPAAVAEMVRRVGAATGFTVRDTARALESDAPAGLPGWEAFWDDCHLTDPRFYREAAAVLDLVHATQCAAPQEPALRSLDEHLPGMARFINSPSGPGLSQWYAAIALALEARARGDGDAVATWARRWAQDPGGDPAARPWIRLAVAEGLRRAGRDADADVVGALAREADGAAGAAAWEQHALDLAARNDRTGAMAALARAATLDPTRASVTRMRERLGR